MVIYIYLDIISIILCLSLDEYMYQVCVQNKSTLPPEALFVIRYHSCYAIHNKGEYTHLMDENDKKRMLWLKGTVFSFLQ